MQKELFQEKSPEERKILLRDTCDKVDNFSYEKAYTNQDVQLFCDRVGNIMIEIRRLEGIVGGDEPAVGGPGPGAGVAGEPAGAALDFDEEEALRGEDQQVHLIDRTIVGDKFKVRPGPVRLAVGQPRTDEIKRLALPRGGVADRTRPLCAYPLVAHYLGAGSTDDARHFGCQVP